MDSFIKKEFPNFDIVSFSRYNNNTFAFLMKEKPEIDNFAKELILAQLQKIYNLMDRVNSINWNEMIDGTIAIGIQIEKILNQ